MSSYFYLDAPKSSANAEFLDNLEEYAQSHKKQIYVVTGPLGDQKYTYSYSDAIIVLAPKSKISIINTGGSVGDFEEYVLDIIEDLGSISDKFEYKDIVGRPRTWRKTLFETEALWTNNINIDSFFSQIELTSPKEQKQVELLISLFTGSINDVGRVKEEIPETRLDKVKQKIQLFDGDQTRFIYSDIEKKQIRIQGLSGTGKTELLLHKLKELYVDESKPKILFTCFNKILADSLRSRIPKFFNFMKVEQQIDWEERLWCIGSWGGRGNPHSGAYRYICSQYKIDFYPYSPSRPFNRVCQMAIDSLTAKYPEGVPPIFDYTFIDESQDFDPEFFELCDLVTENRLYIAGDIFQSIFDREIANTIKPDHLLGKCYRTDPKTLMLAHAMGMGLFEEKKLRWLEETEWDACGYLVEKNDNQYKLSREPLRRFEDLEDGYQSFELIQEESDLAKATIELIKKIKNDNPTVEPEDIGVIFLDRSSSIYNIADRLEFFLKQELGLETNKAYETKEEVRGKIFVTNRNNVKGLEFPFVICVTRKIQGSVSYRNALYTMLTRSFIKSYLLIGSADTGLSERVQAGISEVMSNGVMTITEPSDEEKQLIRTRFESAQRAISHYDLMKEIFFELRIQEKYHDQFIELTQKASMVGRDIDTLTAFVQDNMKYIVI